MCTVNVEYEMNIICAAHLKWRPTKDMKWQWLPSSPPSPPLPVLLSPEIAGDWSSLEDMANGVDVHSLKGCLQQC